MNEQKYIVFVEDLSYRAVKSGRIDILQDIINYVLTGDDTVFESLDTKLTNYCFSPLYEQESIRDKIKAIDWRGGEWNPPMSQNDIKNIRRRTDVVTKYADQDSISQYGKDYKPGILQKIINRVDKGQITKALLKGALKAIGPRGREKLADFMLKRGHKKIAKAFKQRALGLEQLTNKNYDIITDKVKLERGKTKEDVRQGLMKLIPAILGAKMFSKFIGPSRKVETWHKRAHKGRDIMALSRRIRNIDKQPIVKTTGHSPSQPVKPKPRLRLVKS